MIGVKTKTHTIDKAKIDLSEALFNSFLKIARLRKNTTIPNPVRTNSVRNVPKKSNPIKKRIIALTVNYHFFKSTPIALPLMFMYKPWR